MKELNVNAPNNDVLMPTGQLEKDTSIKEDHKIALK